MLVDSSKVTGAQRRGYTQPGSCLVPFFIPS